MSEPIPTPPATDDGEPTTDPKPTDTVDFWKQKAREQEKRAKENATAAQRLAEIEEANKTEAQKTAERLAEAEKATASARQEAMRLRIAARYAISDEDADLFLTGTDEDTLTRQAERLAGRAADRKKSGNVVPKEGTSHGSPGESEERQLARELFAG